MAHDRAELSISEGSQMYTMANSAPAIGGFTSMRANPQQWNLKLKAGAEVPSRWNPLGYGEYDKLIAALEVTVIPVLETAAKKLTDLGFDAVSTGFRGDMVSLTARRS